MLAFGSAPPRGCLPPLLPTPARSPPGGPPVALLLVALGVCACGGPPDCAAGELLDDSGVCVPIACGQGPFGAYGGDPDAVYVRSGAEAGDGSESRPYSSLTLALAAGADHIVLGDGEYSGNYAFSDGSIEIVGRCRERVTLRASDASEPAVDFSDPDQTLTLRDITVSGGFPGVLLRAGQLELERARVSDSLRAGVACQEGGRILVDDLVLEGTRVSSEPLSDTGDQFGGLVGNRCDATIRQLLVRDVEWIGIYFNESTVDAADVELSDITPVPRDEDFNGTGLLLISSVGDVRGLRVDGSGNAGLECWNSVLSLEDAYFTGAIPMGQLYTPEAIYANNGCQMELSEVLIEHSMGAGIRFFDSVLRGEEIEIRHLRSVPGLVHSAALGLKFEGAGVEASSLAGVSIRDVEGYGLLMTSDRDPAHGPTLEVRDMTIAEVRRAEYATSALGVSLNYYATLEAEDLEVYGADGPGIRAYGQATLRCSDCSIHDNGFAGVIAQNASLIELEYGSVVEDNLASASEGGGFGVYSDAREGNSAVILRETRVGPHAKAGVYYQGYAGLSWLFVYDCEVWGGEAAEVDWRPSGNAVVLLDTVAAGTGLSGSRLMGAQSEALLVHHGDLTWSDSNTFEDNALDARWQGCPEDPVGPPESTELNVNVCEGYDLEFRAIEFRLSDLDPDISD